jgi:hypothetical protein
MSQGFRYLQKQGGREGGREEREGVWLASSSSESSKYPTPYVPNPLINPTP